MRAGPTRTCVGCRTAGPASSMVRFAADHGALVVGARRPGRGAWLCTATLLDCFDRATSQRSWSRAFRCQIEPDSIAAVRAELEPSAGEA